MSYADLGMVSMELTAEGTCWHPSFVRNATKPLHHAE